MQLYVAAGRVNEDRNTSAGPSTGRTSSPCVSLATTSRVPTVGQGWVPRTRHRASLARLTSHMARALLGSESSARRRRGRHWPVTSRSSSCSGMIATERSGAGPAEARAPRRQTVHAILASRCNFNHMMYNIILLYYDISRVWSGHLACVAASPCRLCGRFYVTAWVYLGWRRCRLLSHRRYTRENRCVQPGTR